MGNQMSRRDEAEKMIDEMIVLQDKVDKAGSSKELKMIEQELLTKMFEFGRHVLLDFVYGLKR
jgi:hypothetical protein